MQKAGRPRRRAGYYKSSREGEAGRGSVDPPMPAPSIPIHSHLRAHPSTNTQHAITSVLPPTQTHNTPSPACAFTCPTMGLTALPRTCPTMGLTTLPRTCPTMGLATLPRTCPTLGPTNLPRTCPTMGLTTLPRTCPTMGLPTLSRTCPTMGLTTLPCTCPTKRLTTLPRTCPPPHPYLCQCPDHERGDAVAELLQLVQQSIGGRVCRGQG